MRTLPKWLFGAIACLGWPAAHALAPPPPRMQTTEQARASAPGPPAPAAEPAFRLDSVRSADGTQIGYRIYGQGPGLLIVQGAMGIAYNYDQLARALAPHFRGSTRVRTENPAKPLAATKSAPVKASRLLYKQYTRSLKSYKDQDGQSLAYFL